MDAPRLDAPTRTSVVPLPSSAATIVSDTPAMATYCFVTSRFRASSSTSRSCSSFPSRATPLASGLDTSYFASDEGSGCEGGLLAIVIAKCTITTAPVAVATAPSAGSDAQKSNIPAKPNDVAPTIRTPSTISRSSFTSLPSPSTSSFSTQAPDPISPRTQS